jgi:hypothetical protein
VFAVSKPVVQAFVFISGLGHYELLVNGSKVGDAFLAPGWTDYDATTLYNTHDVTQMLVPGTNVLGAIVGHGFHHVNHERYFKLTIAHGYPRLLCRLRLLYADGSAEDVVSGPEWRTAPSAITFTSIYGGEDYDARLEQSGWATASFDDREWRSAVDVPGARRPAGPRGRLSPPGDGDASPREGHGQLDLMGEAIHFAYDLAHLYRKQIADMIDAQTASGLIPDIAPEYVEFEGGFRDSPEWGSAGVILPWLVYRWYGDAEPLSNAYPMMKRYVDYLETRSEGHMLSHGLGDWYDLGPRFPGEAQLTPKALTATAVFYQGARLVLRRPGGDRAGPRLRRLRAARHSAADDRVTRMGAGRYRVDAPSSLSKP